MTIQKPLDKQAGITLMETLLVVALLSGILLVLTILLQDFIRREHMRGVAGQMAVVQKAVADTVRSASSFSALYQYAQSQGGVAEISILATGNPNRALSSGYALPVSLETGGGNIKPSTIVNAGYQPGAGSSHSGFRDTLPIRASSYREEYGSSSNLRREARLTVLVRALERNGERALDLLVVTVDRLAENELRGIGAVMDAHGGIISARPAADDRQCHELGCAYTAFGALGNWAVHLPAFSGTRWYDNVMAPSPARYEDGAGEGYLASYTYISEAVIAGDYLYRVAVPGNPDLNRMHARLDLGSNDILGADNVEIRNPHETALRVNNAVHAQGSAFVGGDLLVQGDLDVNGTMRAGDLTVMPQGVVMPGATRSVGNIVVGNRFKTQDLNAGGSLSVTGDAQLLGANAGNAAADTITMETLSAEGSTVLTGVLVNPNAVNASGLVQSGQITAPTVQAQSVGVVQGDVQSGLSVDGDLSAGSGKIQVQGGANFSNLIRCDRGC